MNKSGFVCCIKWVAFVCAFIFAAGCSNKLPNSAVLDKISLEQSRNSKQSPQEALALAQKDIETAKNESLEYYAPLHLSQAEQSLKKAQSLIVKGTDMVTAVAETIKVRKMVAEGLSTKQNVLRQMSDIFEQKERLAKLKTDVFLRDDYEDQMDNIKDLILLVEQGDQAGFEKDKKTTMAEMLELEKAVVKKKTLTEAILVLQDAKKADAKKLCPKTWKIAEGALKQSTVFIESYPRDEEGVKKAGGDALHACQHALFVARETRVLKETDKDDFENVVLDMESKLERIALGLNHPDVRHMSLHDQSVTLAHAAETMSRNVVDSVHKEKALRQKETPSEKTAFKASDGENHSDVTDEKHDSPVGNVAEEPVENPEKPVEPESVSKNSTIIPQVPITNSEGEMPGTGIESVMDDADDVEKKL
jgi:hypothetical protein